MGFYIFMGGLTLLMLFLIYYLFRLTRIGLSEKKQFQDKISILTREKMGLEERLVVFDHQLAEMKSIQETELKAFSQELEKMEKYRSLVEDTEEFLFEMDHDGKFTYANPTMLNRLGYSDSEIYQINYQDLATPEQLPEIRQFYARQYHQKATDSYAEWQTINRFGESVWVGLRVHISYQPNGLISSVKGIARDLSVQKEFEKREKEDNGFFEEIFKSLGQPVMVFRALKSEPMAFFPLFWANEPALRLMDLDWFQIKGIPMDSVSEELVKLVETLLEKPDQTILWQTRKNLNSTYQVLATKSKEWVWICLNDYHTLQEEKEKALNELLFFKKVLDHINVDVAVFSPDLKYQYINQSAVKSPEVRNWMLGKTDEEYVKFRNKNLKKAIFRQAKFNEVLSNGQPIEFEDYLLDGHNDVKLFLRQLIPVGTGSKPEWIIASGTNVSARYLAAEKYLEALDGLRFTNRIRTASSHKSTDDQFDSIFKEGYTDNDKPEIFAGLQKEDTFFLYPGSLSRFFGRLKVKFSLQTNIDLESNFPEPDTQLFFFPRALIELSIRWIHQRLPDEKIKVHLSLHSTPSETPLIQLRFDFSNLSGETQKRLESELEALARIWRKDQFEIRKLDSQQIFSCGAIYSEDLYAGKISSHFPILQGKKLVIGSYDDSYTSWVSEILTHQGAAVFSDKQFEVSNLSHLGPQLIVWVGNDFPKLEQGLVEWIITQNLKMLWVGGNQTEAEKWGDWLITVPKDNNTHRLLEEAWIHCRPVSPFEGEKSNAHSTPINFDKLLEITQGDKIFMGSLFQSYFSSMQECKIQYREHVENANPEGMRFLLHKVRATINTFDIKEMEIFLSDSIQIISNPGSLTEKKKSQLYQKVQLLCESVEKQIREFAQTQRIDIKS